MQSSVLADQVWDYTNDAYVHRLVLSKKDGRLVEIPSPQPAHSEAEASAHGGETPAPGAGRAATSGDGSVA